MKKVSVVIAAYNAEKTIDKAIEACLAQSYPAPDNEVVVVDDGSTDKTAEVIKRYPVKYIFQENAGPAKARNLGWRASSGEVVFFTDSDCVPANDCITKLLSLIDNENVAAAGGTYDIRNPESIVALSIHNEIQFRHAKLPGQVGYLGSFSLAVRRAALEDAGGFDESFRIACGEDADLSYRLTGKGYALRFDRGCKVGHYFPEKTVKFLKQQFWRGFWVMKLYFKHRNKVGKDGYGTFRDAIQPPLYFTIAILTPFCVFHKVFMGWIFLNLLGVFIHTPVVLFAVKRERSSKLLFLYPLLYLRGFFWAAGACAGSIRFYRPGISAEKHK